MHRNILKAFGRIIPMSTLFACTVVTASAQHKISGTVVNEKDRPIRGASVYLDNTLDGGTTDSTGVFIFTTAESGNQTIIATEVTHENAGQPIVVTGDVSGIVIHMKSNKTHALSEVTITAGSFDASNDKAKTVLKPLDIVAMAGSNADVVKAMEMLPGTQKTGTENGLFVRGGDASEAAVLVDEMVVQNAFFSGAPGVTTRSRFNAFQYQGMAFSSGGYSARYGQALSGVLELTSTDLPEKSNVNLGINMAGIYASGTKKWKNSALDVGGSYNNLTPFYGIATTNFKFYDVPIGGGGNLRYMWKPNKNGILKISANSNYISSGVAVPNPFAYSAGNSDPASAILHNEGDTVDYVTKDQYYYTNVSYKQMFKNKYSLYTAASYSFDQTNNKFGSVPIDEQDHRAQYRVEGKDFFTARLNLMAGAEIQSFGIDKKFDKIIDQTFTENIVAGYAELEWTPIYYLALRPGVRYEHSSLLNQDDVAPRISLAVKTSEHSQVSIASGVFYQDANYSYLLAGQKPGLQQAIHYIANWQLQKDDRTLRLEAYYKKYNDLVRDADTLNLNPYRNLSGTLLVNNSGYGYAQGMELFWRDKKTVHNMDYWISYSYIDTKRLYENFITEATPTFIAAHNLNLVEKYFIDKWHTNISVTYSYASGRPYLNPSKLTKDNFLTDRTPDYHNLALTLAYLHSFGKWFSVFYAGVDNITNYHNVFGYRYIADASGAWRPAGPIVPALYRTIFIGANFSLTQFSKDEL